MNAHTHMSNAVYSGLLATAFVSPFAIAHGSGGISQVRQIETSGNSLFVSSKKTLFSSISELMSTYKLNKNQLANVLGVTRPTIYAWLDDNLIAIRGNKMENVTLLLLSLNNNVLQEHKPLLSQLLRRKHTSLVKEISTLATKAGTSKREFDTLAKKIDKQLSSIRRSNLLSTSLADKKSLI